MRMIIFSAAIFLFSACKNSSDKVSPANNADTAAYSPAKDTTPNFFPVTTYIRGEIADIKARGLTPIMKISGSPDSAFVQPGDFGKVFAEFTDPVIDTANLKSQFSATSFKDETLNAFTFTYDPLPGKQLTFPFAHWDVYVDPETNKVTRVYLLKNKDDGSQLQLTWQSGKRCQIVTVKNNAVSREEKISWTYE